MKKALSVLTSFLLLLCGCSAVSVKSEAAAAGEWHIADLVVLQEFLLGMRADLNGRDYDMNNDRKLDVSDIVLLRRDVVRWAYSNNTPDESEENIMYLTIGDTRLTATLADNSSAQALREKLENSPITIDMSDYANFEKVGDLGFDLPRNDEQITTQACDLILYLGRNFVIYYDTNSWNFTRLGRINGVTQDELKAILGRGDVTVTLSLD